MKALGLVDSDKKIFESFILKTYLLTPWPTYAINWNNSNNFGMGPPRDHSCEVWSKSNERFQRRRCLSKNVDGRRTTHDDGRRTKAGHNSSPWALRDKDNWVTEMENNTQNNNRMTMKWISGHRHIPGLFLNNFCSGDRIYKHILRI